MLKNRLFSTIKIPSQKFVIKKQKEGDNDFTIFWLSPYVNRQVGNGQKMLKNKCKTKLVNKELKKSKQFTRMRI